VSLRPYPLRDIKGPIRYYECPQMGPADL